MVLWQSSGQDQTAVGLGHPQAALSNRGPSTEWGSGSDSRLGAGIGVEPRTDLWSPAARLSGGPDDAHQP
jgi:hypothetical protein